MKLHLWILIILFTLAVASCQPTYGPPLQTSCPSGTYTTTVHFFQTERELQMEFAQLTDTPRREVRRYDRTGFAGVDSQGKHHMFVLTPRGQLDSDRIYSIGHELLHVTCGKWHPDDFATKEYN